MILYSGKDMMRCLRVCMEPPLRRNMLRAPSVHCRSFFLLLCSGVRPSVRHVGRSCRGRRADTVITSIVLLCLAPGCWSREGCDLCSSGWYKPSNVTSWSVYYSSAVFQLKTAPLNILMSRWNVCNVTQTAANT